MGTLVLVYSLVFSFFFSLWPLLYSLARCFFEEWPRLVIYISSIDILSQSALRVYSFPVCCFYFVQYIHHSSKKRTLKMVDYIYVSFVKKKFSSWSQILHTKFRVVCDLHAVNASCSSQLAHYN